MEKSVQLPFILDDSLSRFQWQAPLVIERNVPHGWQLCNYRKSNSPVDESLIFPVNMYVPNRTLTIHDTLLTFTIISPYRLDIISDFFAYSRIHLHIICSKRF